MMLRQDVVLSAAAPDVGGSPRAIIVDCRSASLSPLYYSLCHLVVLRLQWRHGYRFDVCADAGRVAGEH
jgi:hypothetical protein